jgi:hypothetical protein
LHDRSHRLTDFNQSRRMEDTVEQALSWSRREVWTRKLLYPGHTFPTAAAPVIVAIGLAYHDGVFAPIPALVAFLAGWLIQFAGVVTDNYENLVQQPEDREHPELVNAVKSGLLTLSGLRTTILVCYGLALVAGVHLVTVGGAPVVVIGLASILASWAYSAGPWPVGRHGWADPLFFVFFGIVSVMGTYYVQAAAVNGTANWAQGFPFTAFAVSLPIGALITNILIIDDIRDPRAVLVLAGAWPHRLGAPAPAQPAFCLPPYPRGLHTRDIRRACADDAADGATDSGIFGFAGDRPHGVCKIALVLPCCLESISLS